jgi:hypothetical protein
MPNQTLVRDLNSLVKRAKKSNQLPDRPVAGRILGGRGVGERKPVTLVPATGVSTGDLVFVETVVVYSEIIITEDGAFEVPESWPGAGAYSGSAVPPSPLPESLFDLSGTLNLSLKVQYYLQKRVHLVFYEQLQDLEIIGSRQDSRLVTLEHPYAGGYYSGLTMLNSDWVLSLKGEVIGAPSDTTLAKVTELEGLGVVFV